MKTSLRRPIVGTLAAIFLSSAYAQSQTDGTWLSASESGDWSEASKWQDNDIADGVDSVASLELPGQDGSYTINVDSARTVGEISLLGTGWSSNRYYTFSGPGGITFQTSSGTPRISLPAGEASQSFIEALSVTTSVQGSQGLAISGNGKRNYVAWNPSAMNLTGGITLEGAGLRVSSAGALGSNAITMSGSGVNFLGFDTDGLTYNNDIILDNGTSGLMNLIGSGSTGSPPPTHTIAGQISQSGGTRSLYLMTGTNTVGGARFILGGDNSYQGTTHIGPSSVDGVPMNSGPVVARATHNNAFGNGSSVIQIYESVSGIELAGDITVSNKTLRMNGAGFRDQGSVNSVSGDNVWAGNIIMRYNTSRADNPRIGVESGSLTVTGVISSGSGASVALEKVGQGSLILTNSNTYTDGTLISQGTIVADHNSALGTGGVQVNGGRLVVAGTRSITNAITFGAEGGALGGNGTFNSAVGFDNVNQFVSPGQSIGTVTFGQAQQWDAFSYDWELDDWSGAGGTSDLIDVSGAVVLNLSGAYVLNVISLAQSGDQGDVWNFNPAEDGEWTVLTTISLSNFDESNWTIDTSGFSNDPASASQWSLEQIDNDLVLRYTIPEPGSSALLMTCGVFCLYVRRLRGRRNG